MKKFSDFLTLSEISYTDVFMDNFCPCLMIAQFSKTKITAFVKKRLPKLNLKNLGGLKYLADNNINIV